MAVRSVTQDFDIVTIGEARARGLIRYFTGKPCKRGHVDQRTTANKTCISCNAALQKRIYERDCEHRKATVRAYRLANLEQVREKQREAARRDSEKRKVYFSKRYYKNRDEIVAKIKAYRAARPGFSNEVGKAYEMRKRRAMPIWVDRSEIRKIYVKAAEMTRETGIQYSVDHIYPLKAKNACGLHVPWNLQIIPKIDNCRKAIKMPDDWAL